MYTQPQLLIMDEATSALDAQTESFISNALKQLKGQTTIISVAHRLSSIMAADKVIYLERDQIPVIGSFNEVRQKVPNFEAQAKLLGIE
jgi:ABC-type bacteriocin/lantibiotic exporter with double-glycine peptidase domain